MSLFETSSNRRVGRNLFDLSHERKLTTNYGWLTPMLVQEVIPGDKFQISTEQLIRMAPMVAPVMHRIDASIHFFFVPNRLIWSEWEDFITGGRLGDAAPVHPYIDVNAANMAGNNFVVGSLADHLGIPPSDIHTTTESEQISALPFRAYQLIYDEYYRDQNLKESIMDDCGGIKSGSHNGPQTTALCTKRKRAWRKDYFTSALPWSQRGGGALIPMDALDVNYLTYPTMTAEGGGTGALSRASDNSIRVGGAGTARILQLQNIDSIENASVTIEDLRKATRLQEWLERSARGGARYIEQILSHFGVKSSDARLQRPEYLGGGVTPIVVSEVLNQASGSANQALGTMGGHGITAGQTTGFSKSFEEHGFVMGIISITPQPTYQNGLDKAFKRFDKFDYYWPEFAQLGEQEVHNREIFWSPTLHPINGTFGYQSRYAEYKYKQSTVHGDFRDSLSYWHNGRVFSVPPQLNEAFVECDASNRIFANTSNTDDHFLIQLYTHFKAIRPIPYVNIPTL